MWDRGWGPGTEKDIRETKGSEERTRASSQGWINAVANCGKDATQLPGFNTREAVCGQRGDSALPSLFYCPPSLLTAMQTTGCGRGAVLSRLEQPSAGHFCDAKTL